MLLKEDVIETGIPVCIYDSIGDIDPLSWDQLKPGIPFYQSHLFLSVIEQLHPGLQFRYVTVKKDDKIIALFYLQLLDFALRNLLNYSQESKGIKKAIKQYFAKKNAKLLNLGDVFFTGDKGIISQDENAAVLLLPEIFKHVKRTFPTSPNAYLVANIYLEDQEKCMSFCNSAFHPFITEPDMFLTVDPSWKTFDDYMNALSSKYRVRARKVLNLSKHVTRRELSLSEISAQKPVLNTLYNNVVNHVAFNMAVLDIRFFEVMKELYGDSCRVCGYFDESGSMLGFCCLFHIDPSTLHVHYIGLNYEANAAFKLYNRMLLDFVAFAIERKVQKVHFGRTATEIKSTIGAQAYPLQAYLKMNSSLVNIALPYLLKRIKPQEYTVRNPFK